MASLFAHLLSQQTPSLQTRKALILTGLQHDFLSPDGKLPVSTESGFLDRLKLLVNEFRAFGDVIWVRTEFEASRGLNDVDEETEIVITSTPVPFEQSDDESSDAGSDGKPPVASRKRKADRDDGSESSESDEARQKQMKQTSDVSHHDQGETSDIDEELFLSKTASREPCCVKGTIGADYSAEIKHLVADRDLQVIKSYYSAFSETSLLLTLRSKFITELFVCGCMTNMSVYATAMDAARYGIKVTLVQDCLGYRKRERHDLAIKRLVDIMEADVLTSRKVIKRLKDPSKSEDEIDESTEEEEEHLPTAKRMAGDHAREETIDDLGPLEADSADEDSDFEPVSVRQTPFRHQPLELRQARLRGSSLPFSGVGSSVSAPFDRRKPSGSASAEQTFRKVAECTPALETGGKSTIEFDALEPSVADPSGHPSVNEDETRTVGRGRRRFMLSSQPPSSASRSVITLPGPVVGIESSPIDSARHGSSTIVTENRKLIPLFGPGKESESLGSYILSGLLPTKRTESIFEELLDEVDWQRMHHQTGEVPRLVCCQGSIAADRAMPLYRHPADQTLPLLPWTATVDNVRRAAEQVVGHELNHALIQLYRDRTDFISEHSDKTLDIVHGSKIVNVSFGAERTMRLRTKRTAVPSDGGHPTPQRTTFRVRMPHNSAIIMSLEINARYLHGINPDKRLRAEMSEAETAFGGQRISITFRNIGTFIDKESTLIWGQGANGKTQHDARIVINGDQTESQKLLKAFGTENQVSRMDWEACYGGGSDVLHLRSQP